MDELEELPEVGDLKASEGHRKITSSCELFIWLWKLPREILICLMTKSIDASASNN